MLPRPMRCGEGRYAQSHSHTNVSGTCLTSNFMKMPSQNLHLCNTHFFMTLKPQNISQIPNQIAVN